MVRLYHLAVCSISVLQPLASTFDISWNFWKQLYGSTGAKLAVEQVALELGPQLSDGSAIFGPHDSRWKNTTERYDPYMQPQFRMVVQPSRESDIVKIVSR